MGLSVYMFVITYFLWNNKYKIRIYLQTFRLYEELYLRYEHPILL
jgi:hypothetical protein